MASKNDKPSHTVLVVEDVPTLASSIAQRLSSEGWDVRVAQDGISAIRAAAQVHPDLVIMDVMLPGIDGVEATKRIVSHRPVPVLMLTARDEETDVIIGLSAGADDYMTKPFSMRELLARKPKSVLTREQLLEEVWDWVDASGTRTVDSHVKALRHKLGSSTIRTVHGVGYAFEPPE